jgi:ATP-binding cassette subfamily B protein
MGQRFGFVDEDVRAAGGLAIVAAHVFRRHAHVDLFEERHRLGGIADVFIERLPKGYDTMLTESGSNLSQGQRQLISIARAVLANPKILILDEATSSVDTRTEMQIQSAMIKLMENRTSLVIAHRLSTIRDADRIIVLSDGHIVESGNHGELLEQKGVYYNLYMTQFSGISI